MALLPTNQRDQTMVLIVVVALAALGAYWYLAWSPKHVELVALEARIDTLEQSNERAKRVVASGNVEELKREADAAGQSLAIMRKLVPASNEVPSLLEQISSAARRSGLDISDVVPRGVTPGPHFDTYKYELGVSGAYHQIAEFLTSVGSLERIVAPMNLSLLPSNRPTPANKSPQLRASFEVQTYVVHPSATSGANSPAGTP